MTDERLDAPLSNTPADTGASPATDADAPGAAPVDGVKDAHYGVGPFSVREVAIGGVWFVAFVVSFFSLTVADFISVWTGGLWWILTIGAPTVAVFLLALRRLSPEGIRRVGSLGIDQFASVAFSVSLLIWIQFLWQTVAVAIGRGYWGGSWVLWVEAVLMLAGVALTVFAPFLPVLGEDFRERPDAAAHRNARPARPVRARPVRERPVRTHAPAQTTGPIETPYDPFAPTTQVPTQVASEFPAYGGSSAGGYGSAEASFDGDTAPSTGRDRDEAFWTPQHTRGTYEPAPGGDASDTVPVSPAGQQAFWALAPEERDVLDESGRPLFRVGPTAWALVVEDRGSVFVVRHEDGRTGYLHDITGVMRG